MNNEMGILDFMMNLMDRMLSELPKTMEAALND